jgi:hypothetical protein
MERKEKERIFSFLLPFFYTYTVDKDRKKMMIHRRSGGGDDEEARSLDVVPMVVAYSK